MKNLLLLFLLSCSGFLTGQDTLITWIGNCDGCSVSEQRTYHSCDSVEIETFVSFESGEEYQREISIYHDEAMTLLFLRIFKEDKGWVWENYYPNGQLSRRGIRDQYFEETYTTWYYPNGQLMAEGPLAPSSPFSFVNYYSDGSVRMKGKILGAYAYDTLMQWHPNGQIASLEVFESPPSDYEGYEPPKPQKLYAAYWYEDGLPQDSLEANTSNDLKPKDFRRRPYQPGQPPSYLTVEDGPGYTVDMANLKRSILEEARLNHCPCEVDVVNVDMHISLDGKFEDIKVSTKFSECIQEEITQAIERLEKWPVASFKGEPSKVWIGIGFATDEQF